MAKYYTLDEDGNPVEHEGEAHDMPTDYKQKLLEYGWIPPAAALGAKVVKEGVNLYKSRRSAKEKPSPMAFGDEGIIDVPSRQVPEKQPIPKGWEDIIAKSEANAASKAAEAAAKANAVPAGYTQGVPGAVNPMDQLTTQPAAYPLIKPEALAGAVAPAEPMQAAQLPVAPPSQNQSAQFRASQLGNQAPPPAAPPEAAPPAPLASSVAQRTRRNAEQIAADREALLASAPEGRLPSAPNPKKSNKLMPGDVVGQGGWHWYQGQMGPEAEENWLRTFGRTNVPVKDVQQAMKEGRLAGPVVPEGKQGGAFPREATVPNYIKGRASLGSILSTAAGAGLMATAGSPEGQEAMRRAASAIRDLGVSPDMLMSKGEELGRLGNSYVNAGNQNYRAELQQQIAVEQDPKRLNQLIRELQKTGTVGGGRGVAPPSAYR
jgi:hypothetical protein